MVTASVIDIEASLSCALPEPYRSFLNATGESFLAANDRTLVYGRDALVERNETFEAPTYCPGNVVIGDDSGGTAFLLSLSDGRVRSVDIGAMTPDSFQDLAASFSEWAEAGFPYEVRR